MCEPEPDALSSSELLPQFGCLSSGCLSSVRVRKEFVFICDVKVAVDQV